MKTSLILLTIHQSPLPNQFVVAKSMKGEYITKRKGVDYMQVDYEEGLGEESTNGSEEGDGMSGRLREAIHRHETRRSAFKKVSLCIPLSRMLTLFVSHQSFLIVFSLLCRWLQIL